MPELPDINAYITALEARILGRKLERVRLNSPFLLRTFAPPLDEAEGKTVRALRRIGKTLRRDAVGGGAMRTDEMQRFGHDGPYWGRGLKIKAEALNA